MPTISARVVRKPRKTYRCDGVDYDGKCGKYISGVHVYAYGNADTEKPWGLRLCPYCAAQAVEEKISVSGKEAQEIQHNGNA